jgi:leucyl aminopeptidase
MLLSIAPHLRGRSGADLLVLPFFHGKGGATPAASFKEFAKIYNAPLSVGDFQGKEGETQLLYAARQKEKRILLLGLGGKERLTHETIRRAFAAAVKVAMRKKCKAVNVVVPDSGSVKAVVEGISLTNYTFDQLKHDALRDRAEHLITKLCLIGVEKSELADLRRTLTLAQAVYFVRDLVNGNADDVTPQAMCRAAKEIASEFSTVKTTIFDKARLEKEKMGLLLAVGRGSAVDPAFILIEYKGDPSSKEQTALVGKGITYDTGGLCIKPGSGMETMKCDMAGGATVLGTIRAAAALKLKCNLIGAVSTTENAVGPSSYKVGDVYKSHSGKTVEIADTDAEGRLVLADAVSYVLTHFAPKRMIDLATLTGGVVVALGEEVAGLFSNNDTLAEKLLEAGRTTGELVWRLPLHLDYKEMLKSKIADIKNSGGGRLASPIKGALFIHEFVGNKVPWAHIDIAGLAYPSTPKHYYPTNATGAGVRLLIEFLER